ncbi:MAG: DUF1559 domain-containing protein [Phycisphaerales bacterium]|nr:DUF1559 domain-containing protein [Phycisphaerales bacterium]
MRRWIAALVACWLWVGIARGQELDRHVPGEGTVFYLQWKGADALRGEYGQSRLKKVVDESNLPRVFSEFLPRVVEKIRQDAPLDAKVLGNWLDALQILGHYPTAIWWGGFVNPADRRPVPRLAVICEPKDQAAAVRDKLLAALGDNANKWTIGIHGDLLWVSLTPYLGQFQKEMDEAAEGHSLANQAGYIRARAQVMKDPSLLFYVNGERFFEEQRPNPEFPNAPTPAQAIEAWKLNGFKGGILAAGFDGADWNCSAFVDAPAPREGLLSLLDHQPLSDELLDVVPQSATGVITWRLNLLKGLNEIRAGISQVEPRDAKKFNQMLGLATMTLGLNVETDLLAAFGDEWLLYDTPEVAGGGIIGTVLVNRLADEAKAERSLDAVARFLNNVLAGQLRNSSMNVAIRQIQSEGITVRYLATPLISPAWTVKDGFLYISLYPEVTAEAVKARGGKSIRDNDDFAAVQKRLGVSNGVTAVSFHDLPKQAPRAYPVVLMLSRAWLGVADLLGVEAPELILPTLGKIMPQLTPSGSVSWVDEAGWHYRLISPFPGSGAFAGEIGAILEQYPGLVAALVPTLAKARESARQVACLSQMRQLSIGIIMYANDHKGQTPPDLGAVLPYLGPAGARLIFCPEAKIDISSIPADVAQRSEWIDEHSSYEYLLPNVRLAIVKNPVKQIMFREKSAVHDGKMNVLFADGHVETLLPYQVENLIDAANQQDEGK